MSDEKLEDSLIQELNLSYSLQVPALVSQQIQSTLIVCGQHNMYAFGTIDGPQTIFRMLWTLSDFVHSKASKSKDEATARQIKRIQLAIEDCMDEAEILMVHSGPHELSQQDLPSLKKDKLT